MKKQVLFCIASLLMSLFYVLPVSKSVENGYDPSSIEVSETNPLVSWSIFWRNLKRISYWRLQWLNETENSWQRQGLHVLRTYPQKNTTKIMLNFTSTEKGSYRLDFAIQKRVKTYVNKSGNWRYELRYDYTEDRERSFLLTFDWSDIKNISGLIIKHGVKNNYFWFRIRRDNVPANYNIILDPSLVVDQDFIYATKRMNQIKTFRNPIGLQYRYAMFYFQNTSSSTYELRMYKSETGATWTKESTIHNYGANLFEGASLWIYDNSTFLIIYTLFADSNGNLYFRNGTITNSEHSITWNTKETVITGAENQKAKDHLITVAKDGYIWLLYEKAVGYGTQILSVNGFNSTTQDWNEVGNNPFLNATGDGAYIYVQSGNSVHEWFSFENLSNGDPLGHLSTINLRVWAYQETGGNDLIEATVSSLGTTKTYSQQTPPTSVYGWVTWDIENLFVDWTSSKIDDLKFSLKKISKQSSQWVYADYAQITISLTPFYDVKVLASEQAFNVSSWSSETTIFNSKNDGGTWGARTPISIAPFNATRDMMVCYDWFKTGDLKRHLRGLEMDFNGLHFTEYVNEDLAIYSPSGTDRLRTVVDTDNQAHVIFQTTGNIFHVNWTIPFPFGWDTVTTLGVSDLATSTSIDKSVSPNILYVFYRVVFPSGNFSYKTSATDSINWSSSINVKDNSEALNYFSASYEAYGNVISLIYTTQTTYKIRYYEIVLITPSAWIPFLIRALFLFGLCGSILFLVLLKKKRVS